MPPELRKQIRNIILVGVGAFLLVNGCSWQPGYGGRNDRKPGMEVERYFGWPACFYADLWRSDEPTEVEPWSYAPPLPITSDMYFVYCSFSVVPLLLDAGLVIASVGLVIILCIWSSREKLSPWMVPVGIVLLIAAWAVIKFGEKVSVYL